MPYKDKELGKERKRQYYQENRQKILDYHKEYYNENREQILQRESEYRSVPENKEKINIRQKRWLGENKEKRKSYQKEYHASHKKTVVVNKKPVASPEEKREKKNAIARERYKEMSPEQRSVVLQLARERSRKYHKAHPRISERTREQTWENPERKERARERFSGANNPNFKGGKTEYTCVECGTVFFGYLSGGKPRKYCSIECSIKSRVRIDKVSNALRGKTIPIEHRKKLSKSHIGKQTGEQNSAWKGGIHPLRSSIRESYRYAEWRTGVFERDNFTCQNCGNVGGKIEAHHIKLFSKLLSEFSINDYKSAMECEPLWVIENGITLCKKCHRNVHKRKPKSSS